MTDEYTDKKAQIASDFGQPAAEYATQIVLNYFVDNSGLINPWLHASKHHAPNDRAMGWSIFALKNAETLGLHSLEYKLLTPMLARVDWQQVLDNLLLHNPD